MSEHYCELYEWKTIGEVSTQNGMLAIVAPYLADTLGKWWDRQCSLPPHEFRKWFEEHRNFVQFSRRSEDAFLVQCDNGYYDVQARFCDLYGDGHLSICELRIVLHNVEHEDEDDPLLSEVDP